ncbi:DUF5017 domain-containing protein [Flavobacterium sp.]|uniref:DUF5017 domain-containing protein n=1 Tax=Flavobacterium sp. TaxID=239 RepID=UPI003F69CF7F
MKKILIKAVFLLAIFITATSCVKEDDFAIPTLKAGFVENFNDINFNQTFDYVGWTNFAEAGTKVWIERDFQNDGYIQFSSFQSGESSNIGWVVSPAININGLVQPTLSFETASNFVTSPDNKIEVFVSTNFNGTDVLGTTWNPVTAELANNTTNNYTYIPSGNIDLSAYSGDIYVAFKVTGNGSTQTGLFQVDKIKVASLN